MKIKNKIGFQDKVAAGIVLFNPNIDRLRLNLESITQQVDKIFIVDNDSKNIYEILKLLLEFPKCQYIRNTKNLGIAIGLNQIFEMAEKEEVQWLLTLDDDSVCDKDLVEKLLFSKNIKKNIGIICANACDDKVGITLTKGKNQVQEVKSCITAGSMTSVKAWRKIGGFDEKMFIDFVDIEFCTRLSENNYEIWKVNDTFVHQQYGNIDGYINILGHRIYLYGYSPERIYYSVRNQIYYLKKHWKHIDCIAQVVFLLGYIGKHLLFEKKRIKNIKSIIKGLKDGIRMQIQ